MGLFTREKPSIEQLEEERDRLVVEEEVEGRRASVEEKKAIIKELKQKYGPRWKSLLGIKGPLTLETLRSFLSGPKSGLRGTATALRNPSLSALPPRHLRR